MMRRHLMRRAKYLAYHNNQPKWNLGAVLASGNKVISTGINRPGRNNMISSPRDDNPHHETIHAEMDALKKVQFKDVSGMDLYVARWSLDEQFRLALPCETCYDELQRRGIRRVFFTSNTDEIGKIVL